MTIIAQNLEFIGIFRISLYYIIKSLSIRVMNTETGFDKSVQTMTRFYGNSFTKEADVPMNLRLLQLNADQWTASKVYKEVIDWMQAMPKDRWPNWRVRFSGTLCSKLSLLCIKLFVVFIFLFLSV